MKLLVVDDDADSALSIKNGLDLEGYVVDICTEPTEALSKFRASYYDLVLLEIRMPKLNGLELYLEMKKINDSLKVCFMTAFEVYYESLIETHPRLNVKCFIQKPVTLDNLLKAVASQQNIPH